MESRQNISVGQEVLSSDLVKISSREERGILDYFFLNIFNGKQNAFFKDSLKLTYLSASTVTMSSGLGTQHIVTDNFEPDNKPVYLAANTVVQFDAADGANDRIDIVCVKANLVDGDVESRKFKDANTSEISNQDFVIFKKWAASHVVVPGIPAGVPVAPDTPVGYLRIHSVLINQNTGIDNQADITDEREFLPYMSSANETGSHEFNAIVGDTSEVGVNYAGLKAALDVAQDGWNILVKQSETLTASPEVINNDIGITVNPGVVFTKGTATKGLIITGDRARVTGMKFKDFDVGGDIAVQVDGEYCSLFRMIYNNCVTEVSDNSDAGVSALASITE